MKYKVEVPALYNVTIEVEADSAKEAFERVWLGKGRHVSAEHVHDLAPSRTSRWEAHNPFGGSVTFERSPDYGEVAAVEFIVLHENSYWEYAMRPVPANIAEEDLREWAIETEELFGRKAIDVIVFNRITEPDDIYPVLSKLLEGVEEE